MDEEQMIIHQEAIMMQELELLRAKLKYVRLLKSENQKGISSPCSSQSKDKTSPVQTETGKDLSNPLMVNILPKDMKEVQTSITLVKPSDLNLRPNGGIQIPKDSIKSNDGQTSEMGIQIPGKDSKQYYVVFNGPNAGIYDNWEIAKKATEGISNIKHKKYKSFLEARTASNIYCREQLLSELRLIDSSEGLRPNTFAAALQSQKKSKVFIGSLPQKIPKEEKTETFQLSIDSFEYLYKNGRISGEEKLIEEKLFTSDGKNISLFNFIKGSDPEQIAETFNYGLVKSIYPSQNLKEISQLPRSIYKTVKNFRTKVLKSEKDIFLKIQSSIPMWDEQQELVYAPQHIIQIGISNGEKYSPSVQSACQMNKHEFFSFGIKRFEDLLNKAFSFSKDDKIFVNHVDVNMIIFSKGFKSLSIKDEESILSFQQNFIIGRYMALHDKRICPVVRKKTKHLCLICGPEDSGPPTNKEKEASAQNDKIASSQREKDEDM